jgi:hypothetical protein
MSRRRAVIGIPQWSGLIGLADDSGSKVVARQLIAQGKGPDVVPVRRRRRTDAGILVRDHQRWVRSNEWAKFLAAEEAKNTRK